MCVSKVRSTPNIEENKYLLTQQIIFSLSFFKSYPHVHVRYDETQNTSPP